MCELPDPRELAALHAWQRRELNRRVAWQRHTRVAAAQRATGVAFRAFNRLEAKLAQLMDQAEIDYQWQFPLGRYVYDFLLPGRILIEVHGTYWHADPRFHAPDRLSPTQRRTVEHDRAKTLFAESQGYRLKVIWEYDLGHDRVSASDLLRFEDLNGTANARK